jgi:hypothetical protein
MKPRFQRAASMMASHGWLLLAMALVVKLPLEGLNWALAGPLAESASLNLALGGASLLLPPLYCGAIIAAVAMYLGGGYATLPESYRKSVLAYPRVLAAYLIAMAGTLAGVFVFVLPGLYFAGRMAFALPAAVLEQRTGPDACFRSWALSKEHILELAVYVAALFVPLVLISFLLGQSGPGLTSLLGRGVLLSVFEIFYLILIVDFFREIAGPAKKGAPPSMPGEVLYKPLEEMTRQAGPDGRP